MLRYQDSPKELKKNQSESTEEAIIQDNNGEVIGFKGNVARLKQALKNPNSLVERERPESRNSNIASPIPFRRRKSDISDGYEKRKEIERDNSNDDFERRSSDGRPEYIVNYTSQDYGNRKPAEQGTNYNIRDVTKLDSFNNTLRLNRNYESGNIREKTYSISQSDSKRGFYKDNIDRNSRPNNIRDNRENNYREEDLSPERLQYVNNYGSFDIQKSRYPYRESKSSNNYRPRNEREQTFTTQRQNYTEENLIRIVPKYLKDPNQRRKHERSHSVGRSEFIARNKFNEDTKRVSPITTQDYPRAYSSQNKSEDRSFNTEKKYGIKNDSERTLRIRRQDYTERRLLSEVPKYNDFYLKGRNERYNSIERSEFIGSNKSNEDIKRISPIIRQEYTNSYASRKDSEDRPFNSGIKPASNYRSNNLNRENQSIQSETPYIISKTSSAYKRRDPSEREDFFERQGSINEFENRYENKDEKKDICEGSYKEYMERNQGPSIRALSTQEEFNIYRDRKGISESNHRGLRYDQRATRDNTNLQISELKDGFSRTSLTDYGDNISENDNNDVVNEQEALEDNTGNDEEVVVSECWEEVYTVPYFDNPYSELAPHSQGNIDYSQEPRNSENNLYSRPNLAEILSEYQNKGVVPQNEPKSFQYPIKRGEIFIENRIDTTSAPRTIDIVSDENTIIENNDNPYQNTFRIAKENPLYTNNLDWQDTVGKNRFRKY